MEPEQPTPPAPERLLTCEGVFLPPKNCLIRWRTIRSRSWSKWHHCQAFTFNKDYRRDGELRNKKGDVFWRTCVFHSSFFRDGGIMAKMPMEFDTAPLGDAMPKTGQVCKWCFPKITVKELALPDGAATSENLSLFEE